MRTCIRGQNKNGGVGPPSEIERRDNVYYSRGSEECCDGPKYVRFTLGGIVEPGRIDQHNPTTVEVKGFGNLYGARARLQPSANAEAGPTGEVNELCNRGEVQKAFSVTAQRNKWKRAYCRFATTSRAHDANNGK